MSPKLMIPKTAAIMIRMKVWKVSSSFLFNEFEAQDGQRQAGAGMSIVSGDMMKPSRLIIRLCDVQKDGD